MVILLVNSSHSCNCRWPGGATDNNTYALQAVKEREVLAMLVPCFPKTFLRGLLETLLQTGKLVTRDV